MAENTPNQDHYGRRLSDLTADQAQAILDALREAFAQLDKRACKDGEGV